MQIGRFFVRYAVTLIAGAVVMALSLVSSSALPSSRIANIDKLVHFAMYAALFLALFIDVIVRPQRKLTWINIPIIFLITFCFGIAMEGLQGLTATRTASLDDALANGCGALFGLLTALILSLILKKRRQ